MEKRIKSFITDFICVAIIFVVFWFAKSGAIYNQITTLKNENSNLKQQLAELQKKYSTDVLNNIKSTKPITNSTQANVTVSNTSNSAEQSYSKSQALEVSVRDLLSSSDKYINKEVKIGPLKVLSNKLDRTSFNTYVSTGSGITDFDKDTSIEVLYKNVPNFDLCKNLSSTNEPIIYVSGIYKIYSNNNNQGYIQANNVWISK